MNLKIAGPSDGKKISYPPTIRFPTLASLAWTLAGSPLILFACVPQPYKTYWSYISVYYINFKKKSSSVLILFKND